MTNLCSSSRSLVSASMSVVFGLLDWVDRTEGRRLLGEYMLFPQEKQEQVELALLLLPWLTNLTVFP